jgi:hypothetical protein
MRPLAEGIALFGEFDAWPGVARSISPTFRDLSVAFAETVPEWRSKSILELSNNVLAYSRTRPTNRRRKENLLMQPFSTANGGYLPGYFVVKNLQIALFMHTNSSLILDSEFYLNFIIHWFYGSFDFTEAILDDDKGISPFSDQSLSANDSVNGIAVAFQKRFAELFSLKQDDITEFDNKLSKGKFAWHEIQIGKANNSGKYIELNLARKINNLIDYSDKSLNEVMRSSRIISHDLFLRRNFLCIGSFVERLEITDGGRINIGLYDDENNIPVLSLPSSRLIPPIISNCRVEVLQSGTSERIFFAIYWRDELIYYSEKDRLSEEEQNIIERVNLSSTYGTETKQLMRKTIEQALSNDEEFDIYRDYYRKENEDLTELVYDNWSKALMSQFQFEVDVPKKQGALLEICEGDRQFLRIVAALGSCRGPFIDLEVVADICKLHDHTIETLINKSNSYYKRTGFLFLSQLESYIIMHV